MEQKTFTRWIETIFETQENEIDCKQFQSYLPAFIEAEVKGEPLSYTAVLTAHLHQCPDCQEIYQGLLYVVKAELSETWSSDAAEGTAVPIGD
ncbi:MAG TPA: hypothetical protein PLD25_14850 [Chloroflexota bacterium]|nr:hypothetical protein [Chloroflexota bacterium]HUM68967.1 hypothetical protein [Chloroflexota bacterium]